MPAARRHGPAHPIPTRQNPMGGNHCKEPHHMPIKAYLALPHCAGELSQPNTSLTILDGNEDISFLYPPHQTPRQITIPVACLVDYSFITAGNSSQTFTVPAVGNLLHLPYSHILQRRELDRNVIESWNTRTAQNESVQYFLQ